MDKRKSSYKKFNIAKQFILSGEMACVLILLFFYCIAFGVLVKPTKTSPQPVEQKKEVSVVQVIEAAEPKYLTPTQTPGRRYLKYSYMPEYGNIISELQMLYIKWEDAADLQSKENGFNPKAINPTSGACGLSQALPCKKLPCTLGDIKCDLKWQKDYISQRYGTVTNALKFQLANNWY